MKYGYHLFIAVILLSLISCKSTVVIPYERTGEVVTLSHERSLINVQSSTRAASYGIAVEYAERQAFENILFKGIPNSNQEVPLLASENKAWSENAATMQELIIDRGYLHYITSSNTADHVKNGGVSFIKQNIAIDLAALRKYLESEKAVKKFGL